MTLKVYEPRGGGPGAGKAFFVMFGYSAKDKEKDTDYCAWALHHLGDDVAALQAAGYRVIVCNQGTRELLDAVLRSAHESAAGAVTAGVLWDGHGDANGSLCTSDGGYLAPEELSPEIATREGLKLFIMTTCHTGNHIARWRKALGEKPRIIAWGARIAAERVVDFMMPDPESNTDLDDLLVKHLAARPVVPDGPLLDMLHDVVKTEGGVRGAVREASWILNCWPTLGMESAAHRLYVRVRGKEDPVLFRPCVVVQKAWPVISVRGELATEQPVEVRDLPRAGLELEAAPGGKGVLVTKLVGERPTGAILAAAIREVAEHVATLRDLLTPTAASEPKRFP